MINNKILFILLLLVTSINFTSCATDAGIFPLIDLSTSEDVLVLPNPISIVADEANSQILVANSNVDILYDAGSLAVISVDATDTTAPVLTAQELIETPNFATEMYFDGADTVYIPFRESDATDSTLDVFARYSLGAATVSETGRVSISDDPFGIAANAGVLYVVSDDVLELYDRALNNTASIDLTEAEDAGLDDADSADVMSVAIDTVGNRAVVSNSGGTMFVIDLTSNELIQTVSGPESTRSVLINNDILYVVDAITETVMLFDLNLLVAPASSPESVDDSEFLLASITVGNNPYGLALDAANNRLYVANTDDDTISVIDIVTYQEIARISLAADDISTAFLRDCDQPFGLTVGTYNAVPYLFVACIASHDVAVINSNTLNLVAIFPNTEM